MAKILFFFILITAQFSLACQDSTSPQRIIYLGDSHTAGDFGARLTQNLTKIYNTTSIKRYGVIGASAQHWGKKDISSIQKLKSGYYCDGDGNKNGPVPKNFPTATQLFQGEAPQRVIIALGTNDVHGGCLIKDKEDQMMATKVLLSQVRPGSKCTWIGPTQQASDGVITKRCGDDKINKFIDNLRETVSSRCDFIDSRKIKINGVAITPNAGDKLHYKGDLAIKWADRVAAQLDEQPSSPLKNHLPVKPLKQAN